MAIYVSQGDVASIQWAARNFQHLDGIQAFYNGNANSPALRWLVQNFVNNVQENVDCEWMEDYTDTEDDGFKSEAKAFMAFAERVVRDGKSREPALWKSASAMISYTLGDTKKAEHCANATMPAPFICLP